MNRYTELMKKRRDLLAEADAITKKARKAGRDLSAGEVQQHDKIIATVDDLDRQIEPLAEQRQKVIDDFMAQSQGGVPYQNPEGHSHKTEHMENYSLLTALDSAASGQGSHEREVSQDLARQMGRRPNGMFVPLAAFFNSLQSGSQDSGSSLVPEEVSGLEDALRPLSIMRQMGARFLTGLTGDVKIPRQSAASTASWKPEVGELDAQTPEYDQISLTPRRAGAVTQFSKMLLAQTGGGVQRIVANDLLQAIATALDQASINGSGTGDEPEGILNTTGVAVVPIATDGGAPTREHVIQLEKEVGSSNGLSGSLGYVTNHKVRAKLKLTDLDSGSGRFVWGDDEMLNGYRTGVSTNVPSDLTKGSGTDLSAIIFGDFSSVMIGIFGAAADVVVDPYSKATSGLTRVIVQVFADTAIRQAAQFAAVKDADTA